MSRHVSISGWKSANWQKRSPSSAIVRCSTRRASVFYTPVDAFRPQPEVRQGDIARFDSATNTITVARPTYDDPQYFKGVVRGAFSLYAGVHELKFGYAYNNAYETTDARSLSKDMRTGQCFAAIEGAPHFTGVVPRVSAIYDLFAASRTDGWSWAA
jgi:hypothetical protein